jgi:hypothetical protein
VILAPVLRANETAKCRRAWGGKSTPGSRPIYGLLGKLDTDYVEEGYGVRAILADTLRSRTMVAWGCPMAIVAGGYMPRFHPVPIEGDSLEAALWLADERATSELDAAGWSARVYDPLSLPRR